MISMFIKNIKRAVSLIVILAVILSCAVVGSCETQGKTAMTLTYGDNTTTISSNIYSYYLSYTKTMLLANLYMSTGGYSSEDIPNMSDMPEYWAYQYAENMTYGDVAKMQAEDTIKQILAVAAYCKENKLELSKEELNNIDTAIKEMLKNYYGNSKSALNSTLLRFNINDTIFKEIRKYESLTGIFGKDLFDSTNGKRKITDEMINTVYQETCARVKHILIMYSPGTKDAEGNPEQYSEEELAARKAKVEDLYDRIMGGEDFDSLLAESEDPGTASLPDGYTINENTTFVPEFITAALDMEVGEVRKVESSYGMHIMKKYELLPAEETVDVINANDTWRSVVNKQIQTYLMAEVLQPYIEKIEVNTEETNVFNIASSAVMFDCLELW